MKLFLLVIFVLFVGACGNTKSEPIRSLNATPPNLIDDCSQESAIEWINQLDPILYEFVSDLGEYDTMISNINEPIDTILSRRLFERNISREIVLG
jgi:hypothetical protein